MAEALNTLKVYQALKSAGCELSIAYAVVTQIKAAVSGEVVTKPPIERLGLRIDDAGARMDALKTSLTSRMDSFEAKMDSKLDLLQSALKAQRLERNARLDRHQTILVRWMLALFGTFFVLTQVVNRLLE